MTMVQRIAVLCSALALLGAATAPAAGPAGSYKGKIAFQGYDITFKVRGTKITKVVARMLADCDRDGYSESFLIAPTASWTIKGGRFSGSKVQTVDKTKATVTFQGRISGGKVTGSIREVDYVTGAGIACDTLVRKFTARRA